MPSDRAILRKLERLATRAGALRADSALAVRAVVGARTAERAGACADRLFALADAGLRLLADARAAGMLQCTRHWPAARASATAPLGAGCRVE